MTRLPVLFVLLGMIGAFAGAWPGLTVAWVPLAMAISVGLFVRAWPVKRTPNQGVRIWLSETGIAVLASLIGLVR